MFSCPFKKKICAARSLMQWYKLRLYEQRQKARPDPTLCFAPRDDIRIIAFALVKINGVRSCFLPDPTLCILIGYIKGLKRLANSSIGVRKSPFIRLVKQEQIHPMIHPKRALIRLRLKYINKSLC